MLDSAASFAATKTDKGSGAMELLHVYTLCDAAMGSLRLHLLVSAAPSSSVFPNPCPSHSKSSKMIKLPLTAYFYNLSPRLTSSSSTFSSNRREPDAILWSPVAPALPKPGLTGTSACCSAAHRSPSPRFAEAPSDTTRSDYFDG